MATQADYVAKLAFGVVNCTSLFPNDTVRTPVIPCALTKLTPRSQRPVVDTMADSNDVFTPLKDMLISRSRSGHTWNPQVVEKLRVIQVNSLEV